MALSEDGYLEGTRRAAGIMPSKSAVPAALTRQLGAEYAATQAEKLAQMQRGQAEIEEARIRNEADKYYLGGVKKMLPYAIGLKTAELGVNIYDTIKDYAAEKQREIDAKILAESQMSIYTGIQNFIKTLGQRDLTESQRPLIDTGYYETPFGIEDISQSYNMPPIPSMPMNEITRLSPIPSVTMRPNQTEQFNLPLNSYSYRGGY